MAPSGTTLPADTLAPGCSTPPAPEEDHSANDAAANTAANTAAGFVQAASNLRQQAQNALNAAVTAAGQIEADEATCTSENAAAEAGQATCEEKLAACEGVTDVATLQGYESEAVVAKNAAQAASNLVGGAYAEAIASRDVDFASATPLIDQARDGLEALKNQCQAQVDIAGANQDTEVQQAALASAQVACNQINLDFDFANDAQQQAAGLASEIETDINTCNEL